MKNILAEIRKLEAQLKDGKLLCDGVAWTKGESGTAESGKCSQPVSMIDEKGFVYCAKHGQDRKHSMRCRKLTPQELKKLESDQPIRY